MNKAKNQAKAEKPVPTKKLSPPPKVKTARSEAEKNKTEGMTYPKTSAEGHAGEYLFAYWISRYFKWPCRLLDIDMGLDAQVEIYENELSTGMFIGVQVKTTSRTMSSSLGVQIPYKNLKYWGECDFPIVIVLICLNEDNKHEEPDIYWRHLDKQTIASLLGTAGDNDTGSTAVSFNEDQYLKSPRDREKWLRLWLSSEDLKIIKRCEGIERRITSLGGFFEETIVDGNLKQGLPTFDFFRELNDLLDSYDEVELAIRGNNRLEYLSEEVKSLKKCHERYMPKIMYAFEQACESNSVMMSDFDPYSPINNKLHPILVKNRIR
ncbi:Uncharacterised protein [Salmonella enterica subsp. enterica serovar Hartford]|nr:Uncharacterised protein [Salmonella enterica subsp. enterica serovar Hartford]